MANYNVDIAVALKGAKKLTAFNKDVRTTQLQVEGLNKSLKNAAKDQNLLVRSFDNLNKTLRDATANFNAAASGTSLQKKAARELVAAQKDLNKELKIQEQILQGATLTGQRSSLKPGRSRTLLGQSVTPEGGVSGRSRKILAENQALQEALGSMNSRAFGRFKFMPPIQGTTESQLALKTRVQSNVAESQRIRNIVTAGSNRAGLGGGFLAFSKSADKIAAGVKANVKQTTKTATILSQQAARAAFTDMEFGVAGGQIGPATPFTRAERFGFGKRGQRAGGLFSFPGGRNARVKGGIGSALIGGGFPALFGAGGISSLLGGIAGGAGGALAPGGGFAASIAATALAAQIEKTIAFRKALNKVNSELENMGISSTFSRKQIKELAKEFEITNEEAIKLAEQFKTFGAEQADMLLTAFGSRETFDTLSGLRNSEDVLGKIQSLREQISETTRQDLLQTLATKGSLEAQLKLERVIFDQRKKAFVSDEIKKIKILDVPKEFRQDLDNFKEIKKLQLGAEFEATNGSALKLLETEIKINEQLQFISEFQAPTDQLREMLNPMRQILDLSVSIRDGFEESFKGIIKGTMTVQEAFRSMLNRIADHFLDSAARMAATQIQKGFLGLFSNMFNFGNLVNNAGNEMASQGARMAGSRNLGRRADGGPVRRGGAFIVGERGPELFTPGVSGMITPNHALGGSTSVVVNVDASGSSVEGDEEQANAFGSAIATAIQSELIKQKRPGGLLA